MPPSSKMDGKGKNRTDRGKDGSDDGIKSQVTNVGSNNYIINTRNKAGGSSRREGNYGR